MNIYIPDWVIYWPVATILVTGMVLSLGPVSDAKMSAWLKMYLLTMAIAGTLSILFTLSEALI